MPPGFCLCATTWLSARAGKAASHTSNRVRAMPRPQRVHIFGQLCPHAALPVSRLLPGLQTRNCGRQGITGQNNRWRIQSGLLERWA